MRLGFSLVELSIVLVILGLLTGGILTGQSLIRAAELRSVTTDFQKHTAAYYSFRDKYFGLPGDLTTATKFWGSAGGTGSDATCVGLQASGATATCNGGGDGQIVGITGYTYAERFMAWKHLANAGLIEGDFTGKSNGIPTSYSTAIGTNVPASKLSRGFWDIYYINDSGSTGIYFNGSQLDTNELNLFAALLKPEEAWNLDTKMDDGSPVYGKFIVYRPSASGFANTCASPDDDTATYNLTDTSQQCRPSFLLR